jgi:tetrahydromethanopterin S-methyltransferase subunit C
LFSLWFFVKNKSKIKPEQIQLITLKICLIGFYAFIVVPYHYLFMVSLFVSIPIVMKFDLISRREA